MKKALIVLGFAFCVILGISNLSALAEETGMPKLKTISEIGSLTNTGFYEEALEKCDAAIKKYPKEPEIYYWSGMVKSKLGDNQSAVKDYDMAISLDSNYGLAYVMRGISKSELEDYTGAVADFDKAISINPKDSSAYSMRACVKIQTGDIDGALKDMQTANKLMDEEAVTSARR